MNGNDPSAPASGAKFRLMPEGRKTETVFLVAIVLACYLLFLLFGSASPMYSRFSGTKLEAGQVSERDIVADRDITYVDSVATKARTVVKERQVEAVFVLDDGAAVKALSGFREFRDFFLALPSGDGLPDRIFQSVRDRSPVRMSDESLRSLVALKSRGKAFEAAETILISLLQGGVFELPPGGLEPFGQSVLLLRAGSNGRLSESMPGQSVVTLSDWERKTAIPQKYQAAGNSFAAVVREIVGSFLVQTAFLDVEESARRLDAARKQVEPVMGNIVSGERLVRKGFVVTESDLDKLAAFGSIGDSFKPEEWLGITLYFILLTGFSVVALSRRITAISPARNQFVFILFSCAVVFVLAVFLSRVSPMHGAFPVAIMLPSGLVVMLSAILLSERYAFSFSLVLALVLFPATGFSAPSFLFAYASGVSAALSVRNAEKRIDLIRAGAVLASVHVSLSVMLSLLSGSGLFDSFSQAFWAAFNGFACAVIALGLLPLIEQALNSVTRFRLMELSDLNAPILNRLLTVAPGTYSHSVMVAHLAESAAREIGADPILCRVGAYYHDIGKIDSPDYFIENQGGHNRHLDISPLQSVAIIKGHLSLGTEKARSLGLPEAVVDIVSEHHGKGVIAWFWNLAQKADPEADIADFCYSGRLPSTRESAVVMLADSVEAAVRTLKKPTQERLIEFIDSITEEKVRQGFLANSPLTLSDLETVRETFARILAGHYHSRIEYPKIKES